MKNSLKVIAAVSSLFMMAGNALADDTFTVKFDYSPSAPAEEIYQGFKETAKKACFEEYRREKDLSFRSYAVRLCRKQLLDNVIAETNNKVLMAMHEPTESVSSDRDRIFALKE